MPALGAGGGCRAGRWLCHSWRYSLCRGCSAAADGGECSVGPALRFRELQGREVCVPVAGVLWAPGPGEGTCPLVWDAETLPADQRCAVFGCWEPGVTVRSYGSSLESSAAANLFIQLVLPSGVIPGACRCCCGCAALVWCLCGHTRTAGLIRCFSAL